MATKSLVFLSCWSTNVDALVPFYRDGLELAVKRSEPGRLWQLTIPGGGVVELLQGGVAHPAPADRKASLTNPIFLVDDADATIARLQEHGGTLINPPFVINNHRIAYLTDPDGRVIGVLHDLGAR